MVAGEPLPPHFVGIIVGHIAGFLLQGRTRNKGRIKIFDEADGRLGSP